MELFEVSLWCAHLPSWLTQAVSCLRVAPALILALARRGAVGAVPSHWARGVTESPHPAALAGAGSRLGVTAATILTLAHLFAIEAIVTLGARLLATVAPPSRATCASTRDRVAR